MIVLFSKSQPISHSNKKGGGEEDILQFFLLEYYATKDYILNSHILSSQRILRKVKT